MQFQSGNDAKGEWLDINYYDEEGTSVSERFRLTTPAQRKVFELKFLREHQRAPGVLLFGIMPTTLLNNLICYVTPTL